MKRFIIVLAVLASAVVSASSTAIADKEKEGGKDPRVLKLADGNAAFAMDLFSRLGQKEGNLFFSPFSVSAALAMTLAGAAGNTEAEMTKVLRVPGDREQMHRAFGLLLEDLNARKVKGRWEGDPNAGRKQMDLVTANALWGQTGYPFKAEFTGILGNSYKAGFNTADFKADPEKERLAINKWVEEKTAEKIKNLLPAGSIHGLTRLVLANAVYFKAAWEEPFVKQATREGEFTLGDGTKKKTPFMRLTHGFRHAKTDSAEVLVLPYLGREIYMAVLLPPVDKSLKALENGLDAEKLRSMLDAAKYQEVQVTLPKFRIESSFELKDNLIAMGMKDAFSDSAADFSRMADTQELFIGLVVHKAFVNVDEEGTEAAAATAVAMEGKGMADEPVIFKADRPFLFLICDGRTGSILFIGRLANPA